MSPGEVSRNFLCPLANSQSAPSTQLRSMALVSRCNVWVLLPETDAQPKVVSKITKADRHFNEMAGHLSFCGGHAPWVPLPIAWPF